MDHTPIHVFWPVEKKGTNILIENDSISLLVWCGTIVKLTLTHLNQGVRDRANFRAGHPSETSVSQQVFD